MLSTKNILIYGLFIALGTTQTNAKELRSAPQLFVKKCAMCHTVGKPKNKADKKKVVAPPIDVAVRGVVITIDALDGPFKGDELKEETIAFMKDYIYEPSKDKTGCEDKVIAKFGLMPSLKGFITPEELDILIPWVYEQYKPTKVNGKY